MSPELLGGLRYTPTSGHVAHDRRRALVIHEANLVSSARHVPGVPSGPPIRVLYVEANEDGTVGGSYQALYDLVRTVPRHRVEPTVLFYQHNAFADRLREKGIAVLSYDQVRASERATNTTAGVVRRRLAQVGAIIATIPAYCDASGLIFFTSITGPRLAWTIGCLPPCSREFPAS